MEITTETQQQLTYREEVKQAWPFLIQTFAYMLAEGPGADSKWTPEKYEAKMMAVMKDLEALHGQMTAGPSRNPAG